MEYAGLAGYLDRFQRESGFSVIIKDFSGLFEMEETLLDAVQDFYIHKSPYCMAIKGSQRLWDYCLLEKKWIHRKLMRDPVPFFGCCYAGIGEYVIPVLHRETVIAALVIGCFRSGKASLDKKWAMFGRRYGMNPSTLSEEYARLVQPRIEDMEPYRKQLEIVGEYLRLVHEGQTRREKANNTGAAPVLSRSYTLSHVLEYLRLHHTQEVTLTDVAAFCHCSKSYISHQFRRYTQMTIKAYINQLRVNSAKELLKSGKSVTEAAYSVGFKDSNYFSKVFRELEHKTPTAFLHGQDVT